MSEFRLRLVFVISVVILGVMAVPAVFRPLATGKEYSAVARESVLQDTDQWVIQFDIINLKGKDMNYNVVWSSGGQAYTEQVMVGQGRTYSHILHVYQATIKKGEVGMTIYEEGETTPFDQVTYHLY